MPWVHIDVTSCWHGSGTLNKNALQKLIIKWTMAHTTKAQTEVTQFFSQGAAGRQTSVRQNLQIRQIPSMWSIIKQSVEQMLNFGFWEFQSGIVQGLH